MLSLKVVVFVAQFFFCLCDSDTASAFAGLALLYYGIVVCVSLSCSVGIIGAIVWIVKARNKNNQPTVQRSQSVYLTASADSAYPPGLTSPQTPAGNPAKRKTPKKGKK